MAKNLIKKLGELPLGWGTLISAVLGLALSLIALFPAISSIGSAWDSGDMLSSYVNANQWNGIAFGETTQFGYPLGMNLNLFPSIDITQNLFAHVISNLTGNPFFGLNLLIVISFPLVAALTFLSLRLTGLRGVMAVALAIAFTMIPFHFDRALGHPYLGSLYSAVTAVILAQLIGTNRIAIWFSKDPSRHYLTRRIFVILIVIITAWSGIYFALFGMILMSGAWLWRLSQGSRGKCLIALAIPIVGVAVLVVIGFIPALIALASNSPFAPLAVRFPYESVIFAGNLAIAVLVAPIGVISFYNSNVLEAISAAPAAEGTSISNYGTWITVAAIVTLIITLFTSRRKEIAFLITLLVVSILFFIPWGPNYFFAAAISPQIRAWNRFLPIILLLLILILATVLTRLERRKRMAWMLAFLIVLITTVENIMPFASVYRDRVSATQINVESVTDYTSRINDALPQDCGVLQLPAQVYPENGITGDMNDYEHFYESLIDPSKSWTYGAVKNTSSGAWLAALPEIPSTATIDLVKASGFCGIHVDLRAYSTPAQRRIMVEFASRYGKPITANEPKKDKPYLAFFIVNNNAQVIDSEQWTQEQKEFFFSPAIVPDLNTLSPRGSKDSDIWWWSTKETAIFSVHPLEVPNSPGGSVPLTAITGAISLPTCAGDSEATATITAKSGDVDHSVTIPANATTESPFVLELNSITSPAEATLMVSTDFDGCREIGQEEDYYLQVLNLGPN